MAIHHLHSRKKPDCLLTRQPGCLHETRGFPSPPHDGFGFTTFPIRLTTGWGLLLPVPTSRWVWVESPETIKDQAAIPRQPGLFLETLDFPPRLTTGLIFKRTF